MAGVNGLNQSQSAVLFLVWHKDLCVSTKCQTGKTFPCVGQCGKCYKVP